MHGFTRQIIMQTFGQMLEEQPFDKITVSAIVKKCGISHNTFYYHYKDIFELLDVWLSDELGDFVREEREGGWEENAKALLHSCKDHARTVYHIFNSLSRDHLERYVFTATDDVFYQYVCGEAEGTGITQERMHDIANFCRYAFFGNFLRFLWNNMEDDIDAGVDKLSGLFFGFVTQAIQDARDK